MGAVSRQAGERRRTKRRSDHTHQGPARLTTAPASAARCHRPSDRLIERQQTTKNTHLMGARCRGGEGETVLHRAHVRRNEREAARNGAPRGEITAPSRTCVLVALHGGRVALQLDDLACTKPQDNMQKECSHACPACDASRARGPSGELTHRRFSGDPLEPGCGKKKCTTARQA